MDQTHTATDRGIPRAATVAWGTMKLLSFENVSKRYPDGHREIVVLDRASFEVEEGVFIGVWGARRAGKSTLLRLMAGIESPDAGTVRFGGKDIARLSLVHRERLLRGEIALMTPEDWHPSARETVVELVAVSLGASMSSASEATRRARSALARVGMAAHADELTRSLSLAERMRVLLARALVREPLLLLVDEPALAPSLTERDALYGLLRDLTRESGTALVIASEEMAPLHGAEVVMSIDNGELCSTDERDTIVRFPGSAPNVRSEP
jgi:ABC-type methionine transport system ATPase subunit